MEKDIYDDAIYQLRSGIEALDLINNIDRCLGQAEALSSMMMETSGLEIYSDKETIERYTETIKNLVSEGKFLANILYKEYTELKP